jgi:hypothetical protein
MAMHSTYFWIFSLMLAGITVLRVVHSSLSLIALEMGDFVNIYLCDLLKSCIISLCDRCKFLKNSGANISRVS